MTADGKNRITQILVLLAFVSALAATLYLFFVPAFPGYQGIIFPGSLPPPPVTGWQKFAFWPPIPATTADPFIAYSFIAPVVGAGLGIAVIWIRENSARVLLLWALFLITVITFLPFIADFGKYFLPSAAFLFAAAINETRKTAFHGSLR